MKRFTAFGTAVEIHTLLRVMGLILWSPRTDVLPPRRIPYAFYALISWELDSSTSTQNVPYPEWVVWLPETDQHTVRRDQGPILPYLQVRTDDGHRWQLQRAGRTFSDGASVTLFKLLVEDDL